MSKVLIVGSTGLVGSNLVRVFEEQGKKVSVLVRPETLADKTKMDRLQASGAILCEGKLQDYKSLLRACDGKDVVISAVGPTALASQTGLINAARETGVRRFIPSDYGLDPKICGRESCYIFAQKALIHKMIKEAGLNYTFVYAGCFYEYWAHSLGDLGNQFPPDQVKFFGDGKIKAGFVGVKDVARVAVETAIDPRTVNKEIMVNAEFLSQEELVHLWEEMSDKNVKRIPVSVEDLEKIIATSRIPEDVIDLIYGQILRSVWFRGHTSRFSDNVLMADRLYPDLVFDSVRSALAQFTEEVEMH